MVDLVKTIEDLKEKLAEKERELEVFWSLFLRESPSAVCSTPNAGEDERAEDKRYENQEFVASEEKAAVAPASRSSEVNLIRAVDFGASVVEETTEAAQSRLQPSVADKGVSGAGPEKRCRAQEKYRKQTQQKGRGSREEGEEPSEERRENSEN